MCLNRKATSPATISRRGRGRSLVPRAPRAGRARRLAPPRPTARRPRRDGRPRPRSRLARARPAPRSSSRSSLALRRALRPTGSSTCSRPPSWSAPWSASIATSSSANSGLPADTSASRPRRVSGTPTLARRSSRSAAPRPSSETVTSQSGARSRSSGRARQTTSTGVSASSRGRLSSRSSRTRSAHWMSSTTMTIGPCGRRREKAPHGPRELLGGRDAGADPEQLRELRRDGRPVLRRLRATRRAVHAPRPASARRESRRAHARSGRSPSR